MRDQLKDEQYFKIKIEKLNKDITLYEETLQEVLTNNNTNIQGIINGRLLLVNTYFNLINSEYSYGYDKEELVDIFKRLLEVYSQNFEHVQSYTKLVRILSLALLLNVNDVDILEEKIRQRHLDDYFVNFLLHYIDSKWDMTGEEFRYPGFYESLKEVITTKDVKLLIDYDKKIWYKSHNEEAWYNAHKSKRNTYTGYWDYEGAAVAKALQLDSVKLPKCKYFPYDLIK